MRKGEIRTSVQVILAMFLIIISFLILYFMIRSSISSTADATPAEMNSFVHSLLISDKGPSYVDPTTGRVYQSIIDYDKILGSGFGQSLAVSFQIEEGFSAKLTFKGTDFDDAVVSINSPLDHPSSVVKKTLPVVLYSPSSGKKEKGTLEVEVRTG